MNESILNTIKIMLNIDQDITDFDNDLIVLINSSLATLYQLGVGDKPFRITGSTEAWSELLSKECYLEMIKDFIFIDVKIVFDPPTSSIVMEAYKEVRNEDIWRITNQIDIYGSDDGGDVPSGIPEYKGPYNAEPSFQETVFDTDNKFVREDITVEPIAVDEVSNTSNGKTLII